MNSKQKNLKDSILNYGEQIKNKENILYTSNKETDKFLFENPLAFLIGVIADYGMPAPRVWEIPLNFKKRLGTEGIKFTPQKIAEIEDSKIIKIFTREPKLHRFPKVTASYIKQACITLIQKYNGQVENIWNSQLDSNELESRLQEFKGIGQKKANMAMKMLIEDFKIKVFNKKEIDIAVDVHVRRVFFRTGLVQDDNSESIIKAARQLHPKYPAGLDTPIWMIGRNWCRPNNPKCSLCPLNSDCPKII